MIAEGVTLRTPADRAYKAPAVALLHRLYVHEQLSLAAVGAKCGGAPPMTVTRWLGDAGIERRSQAKAKHHFTARELVRARRLYLVDCVRVTVIAEL